VAACRDATTSVRGPSALRSLAYIQFVLGRRCIRRARRCLGSEVNRAQHARFALSTTRLHRVAGRPHTHDGVMRHARCLLEFSRPGPALAAWRSCSKRTLRRSIQKRQRRRDARWATRGPCRAVMRLRASCTQRRTCVRRRPALAPSASPVKPRCCPIRLSLGDCPSAGRLLALEHRDRDDARGLRRHRGGTRVAWVLLARFPEGRGVDSRSRHTHFTSDEFDPLRS
jgi:hypothetical protein